MLRNTYCWVICFLFLFLIRHINENFNFLIFDWFFYDIQSCLLWICMLFNISYAKFLRLTIVSLFLFLFLLEFLYLYAYYNYNRLDYSLTLLKLIVLFVPILEFGCFYVLIGVLDTYIFCFYYFWYTIYLDIFFCVFSFIFLQMSLFFYSISIRLYIFTLLLFVISIFQVLFFFFS